MLRTECFSSVEFPLHNYMNMFSAGSWVRETYPHNVWKSEFFPRRMPNCGVKTVFLFSIKLSDVLACMGKNTSLVI